MKKSILSSVLVLTLFGTAYADGLTLGTDSIANGNNSITTGKNSIAIGTGSVATGENLTGEKIQEILKENQEQLENIDRLKKEIDQSEKTYAEKLEVWEKVDRSQKKIAENNKLLAETLNPELANLNNEYAQFKPEYDRIIEDMNERLDMISHLDFTLIGTDTENGLSGLASELKESVEEGYNFSLPESFYEDYIENYIEVQGNLQQDEYIYNQNYRVLKDQNNNNFVTLDNENYDSLNYFARESMGRIYSIHSEYSDRNNAETLTESQYNARIKILDDNFEKFKNRLEEGESQFISSEQKKEFIEMEKKKLEINKKVLLSKRLQQEFYDLEKEYGKDSTQAMAKLQERINMTNEFNQLAKEFEASYPKEKVDYIVGKTNLNEFKDHIDDVKNGNIEAKKQLEDSFNEAIKETTDRYDALNKEIKEKEKEISNIEREIAQLTPTEQELKDAEMVESVKKKLDADKQALADALESLKLNDLTDIGENAIAIGHDTLTTGKNAIGMGTNALVTGENAVGIGKNVIVTGENAVALGAENTASGKNSIALGYSNVASAIGAIAIGSNAYATEENAIAIGVDSVADEENVVSFGNDKIKRKIINIADGEVKENSTDAINGGQLHTTNLAIKDLDTKYVNIDNRVTNNTKNITGVTDGTAGLFILNDAKDKIIINHDLGKDVNALDLAKEDGTARKITGVADGEVKENSTDAINGGQLHTTNLAIKDLDTKYVNIDNRVTNNTKDITSIKNNVGNLVVGTEGLFVLNDAKDKIIINHDLGKDVNALDLAKEDGTARKITGVADGEVKENSTDAINGGQLHKTNLAVKDLDTKYVNIDNKVTDIDGRVTNNTTEITNIKNNMGGITSGTAGLFILNDAKDKIIINHDLGKDVNSLDLAKEDGTARKITGVADGYLGKKSTDAINGGQFYASNEALAKYFGGGAYVDENGILVSPKYHLNGNTFDNVGESLKYLADNMGSNIVGGDSLLIVEGDEISIIDNEVTKVATKLNVGDRKITGVANGRVEKGSQEAINGGQLYEVNQQVNANTTQINLIKDSLSHYNNRIKYLEKKVHQNRKVASAGISSAMAMSSIPYSIDSSKVSLGLGVASYDGESAFALGFQGNMTDRSKFRIQFSYDSQNKVGVGAGMAIEF